MRNKIIILIVCLLCMYKGYSQIEKSSNHLGISGLPIYDLFNFFPDNKISGGAINFEYGTFVAKNLSFGFNVYYANVSNEYGTEATDLHREKQIIGLTGLNANLKYYYSLGDKVFVFASVSFGFGNYKYETTNLSNSLIVDDGNEPVSVLMAGLGLDYFVTKNIALELHIPYVFVNRFSDEPYVEDFHTIAPTIGIHYFWNARGTRK